MTGDLEGYGEVRLRVERKIGTIYHEGSVWEISDMCKACSKSLAPCCISIL